MSWHDLDDDEWFDVFGVVLPRVRCVPDSLYEFSDGVVTLRIELPMFLHVQATIVVGGETSMGSSKHVWAAVDEAESLASKAALDAIDKHKASGAKLLNGPKENT
jgi:hypothetical protein